MPKYRKKPVEVEVFEWNGLKKVTGCVPIWFVEALLNKTIRKNTEDSSLLIETLEGTMQAPLGSFIIQGVKGEIYACDPENFRMTYEKVSKDV